MAIHRKYGEYFQKCYKLSDLYQIFTVSGKLEKLAFVSFWSVTAWKILILTFITSIAASILLHRYCFYHFSVPAYAILILCHLDNHLTILFIIYVWIPLYLPSCFARFSNESTTGFLCWSFSC